MSRPGERAVQAATALAILALAIAAVVAFPASAYPGGYTGRTATNSGGCGSCHSTLSGTTTVVLSGPLALAPGATGSFTCVVTHDPAFSGTNHAGIDIAVKTAPNGATDAGTLAASGSDLKKSGSELTHPSAKTMSGSPSTTSYSFTWTAPPAAGTYAMQAIAIVTNGGKPGTWGWATPLSVVVAATEPAPVAGFSFAPASPIAGATVSFTDASTGSPTSWAWSFGDGGTSTARNPTHAWAAAGTYTVTLTAGNAGGTSSTSRTVTVMAPTPTWTATWLLPSSARASGAGGAFWTTDLVLTNAGTETATLSLKFLGHEGAGASGPEAMYVLPPRATRIFADVLSSVFAREADWGPILVRSTTAALAVQGTTWTASPGGGTYGQSVPALAEAEMVGTTPKAIAGVRQDSAFRTNLVLANPLETAATVEVTLLLADGTTAVTRSVDLGPWDVSQLNVAADLGVTGLTGGSFLLTGKTPGGAVAAYASVIDSTTADPRSVLAR
ncbi:MAG: choice-of-anchor V domain-containing protein [Thermoanaerobaculia bacterium]